MVRDDLILICAFLIITQLVVVYSENIDYTTFHDEIKKMVGGLRKKCLSEVKGVTPETLDEMELGEFPDDDNVACYFKCVMEKASVMKKDGTINYKLLSKIVPASFKKLMSDMIEECREIGGSNNCEKAYNFNKCMYRSNPVAFFVI